MSTFPAKVAALAFCVIFCALSARAVTPTISSVSPNPVIGSNSAQFFTISGSNFQSGCTVTLRDISAGQTYPNRTISSQNSTTIVINPIFTTAAHNWTVEVINPGPAPSGQYSFTVVAPQTLTADLSASTTSAPAPLNGVTLTATAGGSATGTINYTFYCDRSDTGTNITAGYNGKYDGTTANPKAFNPCNYGSPGTYYAKVIIERGALAAQKQVVITVTQPTLSVSLTPSTSGGSAPLNGVSLTASVSGTAAGTINYTFYCNRSDSGTNITAGYDGKYDGVTTNPKAFSPCSYASPGTYYAKVIVERGSLAAQAQATITVTQPTLTADLSASTTSGTAPLNGVSLTATAGGTATGTINYTFYCNRSDAGTNITLGYDGKYDGTTANPKTLSPCNYGSPGTYYAKVIIERGSLAAQKQVTITVTQSTLNVSLTPSTSNGTVPLNGVTLTADVSGTATGTINYTFYCDRTDTGTNITSGYDGKYDGLSATSMTHSACGYTSPGTYKAKVIVERGSQAAQAQATITVTQPTLTADLSASTTSGAAPLNGVTLTATAGGTATGTINYTFYCNRSDAGTNITPGYDSKNDGVTTNPKTFSPCTYQSPGTYYAKVIIERGSLAAQKQVTITVTQPTLNVALTPSTSNGTAPLNGVTLTADVSGTAAGTINYTFYCDRADSGTSITAGYDGKYDGQSATSKTHSACGYTSPGTYKAKVIVERGSLAAQAQATITVTQGQQPTLTADLSASTTNGTAPLNGVTLTATAGGTATGTINYTFYCNRPDAGTNVTPGYDGKYDGVTANPKAFGPCTYQDPGTYYAKVIIERGSMAAQKQVAITVTQGQQPTLTADLSTSTTNGPAPLNGVTLTATAGGTATGSINYTFYCNRPDTGTNITPGYEGKYDGVTANPQTFSPCAYQNSGTYYAKVIIERGSLAAQKLVAITVTQGQQPTLSVTLTPSTSNGTAPLSGVTLTANVSGTAAGTINYTFYCDRADSGTSITAGHDGKYDGLTAETKTHSACVYTSTGTYRAKVIVERGGLAAQAQATITVSPGQQPTLTANLSAEPSSGSAPLNGVTLTATADGTATGPVNYTFYCNRSDGGTGITGNYDGKYDNRNAVRQTHAPCNYPDPGLYYAKVIIERGSLAAQKLVAITVGQQPPPTLNGSFVADPAVGIAPLRSKLSAAVSGTASGKINYTVWWNCDEGGVNVSGLMGICGSIPTPPPGTCTDAVQANGWKCTAVNDVTASVEHVFEPGRHVAKVVIERGASVAEARATILAGIRKENGLAFPVRGSTPFDAPIVSVFDHTMLVPYQARSTPIITAFTGESGTIPCTADDPQPERADVTGEDFLVNGNFKGHCSKQALPYDGHAGIDYSFPVGTELYPALSGCVHYRRDADNTLEINPGCAPDCDSACLKKKPTGYTVQYLHLASYPDDAEGKKIVKFEGKDPCPKCAVEGQLVTPDIADPIAYSGDFSFGRFGGTAPHLHFQAKKDDVHVDPYGWAIPDLPDPYKRATNEYLWRDVRLNNSRQPYKNPVAKFTLTSPSGFAIHNGDTFHAPSGDTVTLFFDGTASEGKDAGIKKWRWYVDDKLETKVWTSKWSRTFGPGEWRIVLTVQDANGAVGSAHALLVIPTPKGRAARH